MGGGEALVQVSGITRLPDVKNVSFELHAGEVLGIAGLVGAGRSELLRAIYGVDNRDAGEVLIEGERLAPNGPEPRHRRRAWIRARGPEVPGAASRLEPDQERHAG